MTEQRDNPQLVVIGASAGVVEALQTLVATLPTPFPAPIVIAQHLDPRRASRLREILAARSVLSVRTVQDREKLEAGVIFVVPANRHVEISGHELRLKKNDHGGPRPSVDLLLSTAGRTYGENLIAVILTGSGSDGADGARQVKAAGGTVIVQNPATASFPSMPLSLAPTTVDIVANLETIGPLLGDLLTGAYVVPRPAEDRQLQAFLDQVREQSGIDFSSYKQPTIMRRLQRRMAATGMTQLPDYLKLLQRNPEEYQRLVASFLIKVTEFFRDPELFAYLRDHTLPAALENARQHEELRLWSAGCATGEEAYSLAILVSEVLGQEIERLTVRIFATDLDADAAAFARRGVYPSSALAALPPELIDRYFTEIDGGHEVIKPIRALVVFGQHDLGQRAPFPRIDVALCRNVLIYFTPELQKRALQLFAFSLRDGGLLVLGKSETVSPLAEFFSLVHPGLKIFRRMGERVLIPPVRVKNAIQAMSIPPLPSRPSSTFDLQAARLQREAQRVRTAGDRAEDVLPRLPFGVVAIDHQFDVRSINTAARQLLGIHSAALGEDFIHLVQNVSLTPLRAAIEQALRGEAQPSVYRTASEDPATGQTRNLDITCQVHRIDQDGSVDGVLIIVDDVTRYEQERRRMENTLSERQNDIDRLSVQAQRLSDSNRQLVDANASLTTANADLRSLNEELLVANEEVQAATEEVETLNEELQATNEELETLNEELQATVEELNTTNDDLEARSIELQDLAISVEAQRHESDDERARLEAILVSMGDAVLVVDAEGHPLRTNAAYDRLFGGVNAEWVPEDDHGRALPTEERPAQRAARGESYRTEFTVQSAEGWRRFEAIGQPIRSDDVARGGVVVFRDISERSIRRLQDQFLAIASHELRTPLTTLSGYLQMLARTLKDERGRERAQRYATEALGQVERMTWLVNDLLDVSRLRRGAFDLASERVDLRPLVLRVGEMTQLLSQGPKIRIAAGDDPLVVAGDSRRLEQVLLNLITNALTYAPSGEFVDVRLRRTGDQAEIEVQDYGPGIAEDQLPDIFSSFSRVNRRKSGAGTGLGLGLFICREIVTAHGGTIEVRSILGEGTTFTVRMLLAEEEQ